jgi:transposase
VEELENRLRAVGRHLLTARTAELHMREAAAVLAIEADDAGLSQRRIAELLGVDRMTIRKWIGKR